MKELRALFTAYRIAGRRVRILMLAVGILLLFAAALDVIGLSLILPITKLLSGGSSGLPEAIQHTLELLAGSSEPVDLAIALALVMVLLLLIKGIFAVAVHYWAARRITREEARFGAALFSRYMAAPKETIDHDSSARWMREVGRSTLDLFRTAIFGSTQVMADLFVGIGLVAVLVIADPFAALVSVAVLGLGGAILSASISRPTTRLAHEGHKLNLENVKIMREGFDGAIEAKVFARVGSFVQKLLRARIDLGRIVAWQLTITLAPRYVLEFSAGLMILAVVTALAFRYDGTEIIAVLSLYGVAASRLLPVVNKIIVTLTNIRNVTPSIQQIAADVDRFGLDMNELADAGTPPRRRFGRKLEVRDVRVEFGTKTVLENVNLAVGKGESIGIVGPSGAGKTTLINLLLGLISPQTGGVFIDGVEASPSEPAISRSIGFVPQHIFLADDSIRNNIALGLAPGDIDEARVRAAVRDAQLEGFVAELPDGLDSLIGEKGVRLSGGQRQRIGIARALYEDPDILLLDEATSAMDVDTEARITAVVEKLRGTKTIILVAHRLSTVRNCDRLYFMKEGRILAEGPFDTLNETFPDFAAMVEKSRVTS